ncbi:MAG: hypothetical protein MUC62_10205 [Candidatus Thermoplasmatota archaeon]|jgi:hypothetical protein|nr:hypothetical protein [Candidatus Thermoplasmatota archaeon]
MDTSYRVSETIKSDEPLEKVFDIVEGALKAMGGELRSERGEGKFFVKEGKSGVLGDFLMEADATFTVKKEGEGIYLIEGEIMKKPAALFWVCLVGGFCFWPAWAGVVLYFIADLGKEYQKKITEFSVKKADAPAVRTEPETKEEEPSEEKPKEAAEPPSE